MNRKTILLRAVGENASKRGRRTAMCLAMAAGAWLPWANRAAAQNWVAGSGNWSVASNWNTDAVPGNGDYANIVESDNVARSITYDYTGPAVTLGGLTVDLTGGSNFDTLSIAANNLTAGNEIIGDIGNGAVNQTGGTNTGDVYLGNYSSGSSGTYTLSGGSLSAPGVSTEYVGYGGTGTFNQTGGTNTAGGLSLGLERGSSGTYNLSGTGSLSVGENEDVGLQGTGTFNQTGGTNTPAYLDVSFNGSTYTLNGGSLSLTFYPHEQLTGGSEEIGDVSGFGGTSSFNQSGGTNTVPLDLNLGSYGSGAGIYNLSGTGSLSVGRQEVVGIHGGGTGSFNQTGGTNTPEVLEVGGGGAGTYNLSGTGSLSAGAEFLGDYFIYPYTGAGTFNQTGGTNTTGGLYVTYGGSGTYTLSGTGLLTVTGSAYVGGNSFAPSGSGTLTVNGGQMNVTGSIYVGGSPSDAVGSGSLNVSGGQMTIGGTLEVWNSSGTQVTISGGSVSAGNTVNLATINVTGGSANLGPVTGTGTLNIGDATASVTASGLQQSSVTITSTGQLTLTGGGTTNAVNSLVIDSGGVLDLTTTKLIINYGSGPDPIASIVAWIASGYAGGAWNGTGIMSTNAQANSGSYGIGYADSADPGNPADLPSGTIEMMYTLLGDANLDGKVNGTDFNILATNFNTGGDSWDQGDFNYDGAVNGSDFNLLAENFNQGATQAADFAALDSFAGANGLSADVPEPATVSVLLITGASLLMRRRRKQFAVIHGLCKHKGKRRGP